MGGKVRNTLQAPKEAIQLNWRKTDAGLQYTKRKQERHVRKSLSRN
jgi:hypothetical protein